MLLAGLLLVVAASAAAEDAYDFEVDGIYYKIVENEACVTYKTYTYYSHTANYESDYSGDIVIPPAVTYNGTTYPVTRIGDHAFYQRVSVTSVTIPSSVTEVRWDAFTDCTGLTRVNITDIAAWCNLSCGSNPLRYARHLYLNGTEVTDLVIPESVTVIRNEAFGQCDGLTSVTVGNSVTAIGNNAFEDCGGLKSVTIGNSVTQIGEVAFDGCTSLTNVRLGDAVQYIQNSAFSGCASLKSIEIPNSVVALGSRAFQDCTALTSVSLGNSVATIGGAAFRRCEALTGIEIPNSVTEIGGSAFDGCSSLESVTIGSAVTAIGKDAFINAASIAAVTCKAATTPQWYDLSMFMANVYNHAPLHVPANAERAYKAHEGWGQFITIVGDADDPSVDPDYTKCDVNGDGEVNIADVNTVIDAIFSR